MREAQQPHRGPREDAQGSAARRRNQESDDGTAANAVRGGQSQGRDAAAGDPDHGRASGRDARAGHAASEGRRSTEGRTAEGGSTPCCGAGEGRTAEDDTTSCRGAAEGRAAQDRTAEGDAAQDGSQGRAEGIAGVLRRIPVRHAGMGNRRGCARNFGRHRGAACRASAQDDQIRGQHHFRHRHQDQYGVRFHRRRCRQYRRQLARKRFPRRRGSRQYRHRRSRSDCRSGGISRLWPRRPGRGDPEGRAEEGSAAAGNLSQAARNPRPAQQAVGVRNRRVRTVFGPTGRAKSGTRRWRSAVSSIRTIRCSPKAARRRHVQPPGRWRSGPTPRPRRERPRPPFPIRASSSRWTRIFRSRRRPARSPNTGGHPGRRGIRARKDRPGLAFDGGLRSRPHHRVACCGRSGAAGWPPASPNSTRRQPPHKVEAAIEAAKFDLDFKLDESDKPAPMGKPRVHRRWKQRPPAPALHPRS